MSWNTQKAATLFLTVDFLFLSPGVFPGSAFQSKCFQGLNTKGQFCRTNCSLLQVPSSIPARAKFVHLNQNNITNVPKGIFRNLTKCISLHLGRNLISVIEKGTFEGMVFLKNLALPSNRISQVKSGAFIGLVSIRNLNMNRNLLAQLNSEMFIGIRKVRKILVKCNHISTIQNGAFENLHYVVRMRLDENNLTSLSANLFINFPRKPMELEIGGNPMNCRSLCWLKHELQHKTVKSKFNYTCAEGQWALLNCGVSGVWFNFLKSILSLAL